MSLLALLKFFSGLILIHLEYILLLTLWNLAKVPEPLAEVSTFLCFFFEISKISNNFVLLFKEPVQVCCCYCFPWGLDKFDVLFDFFTAVQKSSKGQSGMWCVVWCGVVWCGVCVCVCVVSWLRIILFTIPNVCHPSAALCLYSWRHLSLSQIEIS